MLNQPSKPAGKPRAVSGWARLQAGGALLILAAALPALTAGQDPMAYQVAALVLTPVLLGLALLWFVPRAGTLLLGAAGLILTLLLVASPALWEPEPVSELLAAWAALIGAAVAAGAAIPAFRSLGHPG